MTDILSAANDEPVQQQQLGPQVIAISQAITNLLLTQVGNTADWPTMVAALNKSIFDVKLAASRGLPAPGAPGAMVTNGQPVAVLDAAGDPVAGSPGTAQVSGATLNAVQLTV